MKVDALDFENTMGRKKKENTMGGAPSVDNRLKIKANAEE